MSEYVTIPAEPETKDRIRSCLRGGERYDDLLNRMLEQYNPDETA